MRMATGNHVGIHANRDGGQVATLISCGFIEQHAEFRFRFGVEEQDPAPRLFAPSTITQREPNLLARFPYSGENNFVPGNTEMCEMFELASGNDIEPATKIRKRLKNSQVAVGLHGKAQRMRQRA